MFMACLCPEISKIEMKIIFLSQISQIIHTTQHTYMLEILSKPPFVLVLMAPLLKFWNEKTKPN